MPSEAGMAPWVYVMDGTVKANEYTLNKGDAVTDLSDGVTDLADHRGVNFGRVSGASLCGVMPARASDSNTCF